MKSLRKPLFSKKKTYLSVLEKSLLLGLLLSFLLTMTGFSGQCEAIENQVFRFHVLANSDSQEDQALKLKVRDRVLEYSEGLFQNAQTREEAEALAAAHLQELCQAAQDEVYRQGYDYPVKAEITNMFFDTREYETVTLPAGCYDALRITIGEAEGHNWWCVLYPRFCFVDAACKEIPKESRSQLRNQINQDDYLALENHRPDFEFRFRLFPSFSFSKSPAPDYSTAASPVMPQS